MSDVKSAFGFETFFISNVMVDQLGKIHSKEDPVVFLRNEIKRLKVENTSQINNKLSTFETCYFEGYYVLVLCN